MKPITVLILIVFPFTLFSQKIRFTVIGEPQISWMVPDRDNILRKGAIIGLNAGIGMDMFFAQNYAFSTGITISNLGGKLSYNDTLTYHSERDTKIIPTGSIIHYKIQYISVPLGLKFKTNEIGYATYFANLGLDPMVKIKARASDTEGNIENDDISDEISLFNINYFILLGAEYSLGGSTAIVGGLGYSSGFADVTSRAIDKVNLKTITIRIGILF
jgi:hypothetical protein